MSFYAVFGHPIAHSRSPQIHRLFAQQEGRDLVYQAILAPLDDFPGAVRSFLAAGGVGANVTVPFKAQAFAMADQCTTRAQAAHAVNTLFWHEGTLLGDNTDGVGLIRDITQLQGMDLRGKRILLLGAGGAAQGVLTPLWAQHPKSLTVANRTLHNAKVLQDAFPSIDLRISTLGDLDDDYDVVINATSGSLQGIDLPVATSVLGRAEFVYDMMYAPQLTPFLQAARQAGCLKVADGLGMLVAQAAASYALWHGFEPDVAMVVDAVRANMEQA
ncbi:shikimate dehydrogenase [Snodgrassella sp. CFCC 13594]|uniref:shikimate dehydrogenase n=1 Tax=Snodgrassella sp. CFCC 13594 TaxID=1775559 RepID=UPI000836E078|nr:shikimate dehydrogenase [Snodgrassella sp. CFCC 13594]